MIESPHRTRTLAQLTGIALVITGIWVIFAFFNASEFYRRSLATGSETNWYYIISFQLSSGLMWAVFTPIVVAMAERLPLSGKLWPRNLLVLAALTPVLSVIRAAYGAAWLQMAEGVWPAAYFIKFSIAIRFHRNVFLLVVIIGITNILLASRRAGLRERDAFALQAAVANAAVAQLRARMLPRVMFDSLRAIADRVDSDPARADRMIVGLSDLLRATRELDRRSEVTLAEELEQIDRYLDLEKARSDGHLTTRIDVDEPLLAARVPALVLHSLVEDALAGEVPPGDRSLEIEGRSCGGRLSLEIRSEGAAEPAGAPSLGETRERLEQLLAERFSLDRHREGSAVVVGLDLPLRLVEAVP